jgi:hypothetical protein
MLILSRVGKTAANTWARRLISSLLNPSNDNEFLDCVVATSCTPLFADDLRGVRGVLLNDPTPLVGSAHDVVLGCENGAVAPITKAADGAYTFEGRALQHLDVTAVLGGD